MRPFHTLEPRTCHPYLWVLHQILGVDLKHISERTGIHRPTLLKYRDQAYVPPSKDVSAMRDMIVEIRDDIARSMSPPPDRKGFTNKKPDRPFCFWYLAPEIYAWRRSTFNFIKWILETYQVNTAQQQPRETELVQELLACLGSRGEKRSQVLVSLSHHRAKSVKRAARRIGVKEVVDPATGKWWWQPPRDLQVLHTVKPPKPAVVVRDKKKSPRSYQIQRALENFLVRFDEGTRSADAIEHVMQKTKCSRVAVFRAARDLQVVRETTGFGTDKVTFWGLSAADKDNR